MRTIKLVIEYDGTDFVGWQEQQNGRSVQEEVAKSLATVLQHPVSVTGAGRTDSGVHARGQVAHFQTASSIPVGTLDRALAGLLPADIVMRSVQEVAPSFHARYDADSRMYRYHIHLRPVAIGSRYSWYVRYALNREAMNAAAAIICGEHDFEGFCKVGTPHRHFRCTVFESQWDVFPDTLVYGIRANRFLRGMVRALVGTMIDVGRGFTSVEEFRDILESRDRSRTGTAAPAHGLSLDEVHYPSGNTVSR
jgi:tRNA pseudouridine38-40 synthase